MILKIVNQDNDIKKIEAIASIVWPITYKDILSSKQIEYMLNKFLSKKVIEDNIRQKYTYALLLNDYNKEIGFFAYEIKKDYLFLSKLYLLPEGQGNGYTREIINYLKSFKMPIMLTVNKYNKKAYEVYLHIGFKVVKPIITNIGDNFYMDDYLMILD